jgi:uncharacterized protein YjbJ (UPF0337 family)
MSAIRERAQGFTKQIVGQMIGDNLLVKEGEEQERKAVKHAGDAEHSAPKAPANAAEHTESKPADRSASHGRSRREER